eukprot:28257-Rhodomonas_salina.2
MSSPNLRAASSRDSSPFWSSSAQAKRSTTTSSAGFHRPGNIFITGAMISNGCHVPQCSRTVMRKSSGMSMCAGGPRLAAAKRPHSSSSTSSKPVPRAAHVMLCVRTRTAPPFIMMCTHAARTDAQTGRSRAPTRAEPGRLIAVAVVGLHGGVVPSREVNSIQVRKPSMSASARTIICWTAKSDVGRARQSPPSNSASSHMQIGSHMPSARKLAWHPECSILVVNLGAALSEGSRKRSDLELRSPLASRRSTPGSAQARG